MTYKYFLFDWDGTLADSLPIWIPAFKDTFRDFGMAVTERQIGEHMIANWNGPAELGVKDIKAYFAAAEKRLRPKLPYVSLNPGAKETLEKIKISGGKIAVVTSSKREWVEPVLKSAGIEGLIDAFLGKEDVVNPKPDPEGVNKALILMGGEREKALVTGDHRRDIEAAHSADMDSVLFYPERYKEYYAVEEQEHLGQTYLIRNFKELEKFV